MPPETPTNKDIEDMVFSSPSQSAYDEKQLMRSRLMKTTAATPESGYSPYRLGSAGGGGGVYSQGLPPTQESMHKLERMVSDLGNKVYTFSKVLEDRDTSILTQLKTLEALVVALVDQNKRLSKRVTDLEWYGIEP
jgi:hypothetical protein